MLIKSLEKLDAVIELRNMPTQTQDKAKGTHDKYAEQVERPKK